MATKYMNITCNRTVKRTWVTLCMFMLLLTTLITASNCNSKLRIYVYDIPEQLSVLAESARKNAEYHICKKCIFEQFALEYIIYDYLLQHCGRTSNPAEADYFYLPIVREIDYRIALSNGGKRAPSIIEEALLDAIERNDFSKWTSTFNVSSEYWRRNNGSDHIIVMPAPVTNLRHQTNMRGFFHYMIHLNAPVFINVEYSKSFTQEYPVCATEKNIIMPYPTIDPDFYAGKLFKPNFPKIDRDKLIFYLGGNHGSCVFVRQALTELSRDSSIAIQRGPRKREEGFQSAVFCPIPIGDSPSSKRMYDVINFGCIPVVLSDELVWAYSIDAGGPLQPAHFSIQLPQNVIQKSAAHVLSKYASDAAAATAGKLSAPHLFNYGNPLPSGVTVLSLLQEIVEEDRIAALNLSNNNSDKNNTTAGTSVHRRRLMIELSEEDKELLNQAHRNLLRVENSINNKNNKNNKNNNSNSNRNGPKSGKNSGKGRAASVSPTGAGNSNTLIRILHKISQTDVTALQGGVREAAQHYQFYPMDPSLSTERIPTALHAPPSGGAIQMLEELLTQRKNKGILNIARNCQAERTRPGHKYVGNYPCEK